MKILYVTSLPFELSKIKGGVDSSIIGLMEGLKETENEIIVISFRSEIRVRKNLQFSDNIKIIYIPTAIKKTYILDYLYFGRIKLNKLIKEYNPDIIHYIGTGPHILYFNSNYKNKTVGTQHGILKEELKNQKSLKKRIQFYIKYKIEKKFIKNFKNFTFISKYNKNLFEKNNFQKSKIISNSVNSIFYNDLINYQNKIYFVGALNQRKGLIVLLKALDNLKLKNREYQLDIIGDFTESKYKEEITGFLNQKEIKENISFHGWKSPEEVKEISSQNSIFILPSYQETLPISICEAMAASKVVIGTMVGGVSEMIKHNKNGFLFQPGNIEELEEILDHLYDNDSLKKEIAQNAYNHALENYKPKSVALKTITFYDKVLNG